MKERIAIYKQGYVREDLTVREPKFLRLAKSIDDKIPADCLIVREEDNGFGWESVEGTERYN